VFSDLVFNLDPRALAAAALGDGRDLNVVSGRPCRGSQGRPELELLVLMFRLFVANAKGTFFGMSESLEASSRR